MISEKRGKVNFMNPYANNSSFLYFKSVLFIFVYSNSDYRQHNFWISMKETKTGEEYILVSIQV